MAQLVTVINRSTKTLEGLWDGRHYAILPGANSFPTYMAEKFKLQNPVMGSEDAQTGHVDYLIGIVEDGDDTSPIEQTDAIEKWDRKTLPASAQNVEVVPGVTGLYSGRDVATNLPQNTNFVKA